MEEVRVTSVASVNRDPRGAGGEAWCTVRGRHPGEEGDVRGCAGHGGAHSTAGGQPFHALTWGPPDTCVCHQVLTETLWAPDLLGLRIQRI